MNPVTVQERRRLRRLPREMQINAYVDSVGALVGTFEGQTSTQHSHLIATAGPDSIPAIITACHSLRSEFTAMYRNKETHFWASAIPNRVFARHLKALLQCSAEHAAALGEDGYFWSSDPWIQTVDFLARNSAELPQFRNSGSNVVLLDLLRRDKGLCATLVKQLFSAARMEVTAIRHFPPLADTLPGKEHTLRWMDHTRICSLLVKTLTSLVDGGPNLLFATPQSPMVPPLADPDFIPDVDLQALEFARQHFNRAICLLEEENLNATSRGSRAAYMDGKWATLAGEALQVLNGALHGWSSFPDVAALQADVFRWVTDLSPNFSRCAWPTCAAGVTLREQGVPLTPCAIDVVPGDDHNQLLVCAGCMVTSYCGRAHQRLHWTQGHRYACARPSWLEGLPDSEFVTPFA